MNQRYDGIMVVGLMLCALLSTWLVLAGPPNLKDWQTLIAALVAFAAASMAYRATMAKVHEDRRQHERETRRRRRGVLLRTSSHLNSIASTAKGMHSSLEPPRFGEVRLQGRQLDPGLVFDLEECWQNIDIFPKDRAIAFGRLKVMVDGMHQLLKRYNPDEWVLSYNVPRPESADQLHRLAKAIEQEATKLQRWMDGEISAE